jgi:hypothetical protein
MVDNISSDNNDNKIFRDIQVYTTSEILKIRLQLLVGYKKMWIERASKQEKKNCAISRTLVWIGSQGVRSNLGGSVDDRSDRCSSAF